MLPTPASYTSLIMASSAICTAPSVEFVHVMSILCNMEPNSNAQSYVFVIIFKHLNKGRIHENIDGCKQKNTLFENKYQSF